MSSTSGVSPLGSASRNVTGVRRSGTSHGAARTSEPVQIDVHVTTADGELRVEVDNTRDVGAPIDRDPGHQSTGVGLRNTRQRLERLYGEAFVLDAGPAGPDHYRITISLPRAEAYA